MQPQQLQTPLDWAATFGHPTGQAILDHLAQQFWCLDTTYQPGIDPTDLAFREGQRSVVVMILQTVEDALKHSEEENARRDSYQPDPRDN